jgi:hypothetical protein
MPKIKNLSNACKVSFSPEGPISEEVLERVRALLGESNLFIFWNFGIFYHCLVVFFIVSLESDFKSVFIFPLMFILE